MFDDALNAIRNVLGEDDLESTEAEIDSRIDVATSELRKVASVVAEFANRLDDGVGFFNSSSEFGFELAKELDATRRRSTVSGITRSLDVDEALFVLETTLLFLAVRLGPESVDRPFLELSQRRRLERIRGLAGSALADSELPFDPEAE